MFSKLLYLALRMLTRGLVISSSPVHARKGANATTGSIAIGPKTVTET